MYIFLYFISDAQWHPIDFYYDCLQYGPSKTRIPEPEPIFYMDRMCIAENDWTTNYMWYLYCKWWFCPIPNCRNPKYYYGNNCPHCDGTRLISFPCIYWNSDEREDRRYIAQVADTALNTNLMNAKKASIKT